MHGHRRGKMRCDRRSYRRGHRGTRKTTRLCCRAGAGSLPSSAAPLPRPPEVSVWRDTRPFSSYVPRQLSALPTTDHHCRAPLLRPGPANPRSSQRSAGATSSSSSVLLAWLPSIALCCCSSRSAFLVPRLPFGLFSTVMCLQHISRSLTALCFGRGFLILLDLLPSFCVSVWRQGRVRTEKGRLFWPSIPGLEACRQSHGHVGHWSGRSFPLLTFSFSACGNQ